MVRQYGQSSFPGSLTYSVEFYRDSSLNTIAYILYKQQGIIFFKYYALRVDKGRLKNKEYFMGFDKAYGIQVGH